MHESKQPDFINESKVRREAGESILEYVGENSLVGGPIGQFEKTPEDDDFLVKGELTSGEEAGVLNNRKLKVEGREGTGEHYMLAHNVLHLADKEVPFDEDCNVCNPDN